MLTERVDGVGKRLVSGNEGRRMCRKGLPDQRCLANLPGADDDNHELRRFSKPLSQDVDLASFERHFYCTELIYSQE
ncbi:hypothetical protein [Candidatus Accumulibacter sp. ACC003]|uniref:hypothetical protein n=1 Tax=Candidatus Accumulibacter sp. ACC003 TaxID=2823334 RepID=UPI0025C5900D|nr:hypothetical protein [Candidatus Accumulibacter sp. ACC003]